MQTSRMDRNRLLCLQKTHIKQSVSTFTRTILPDRKRRHNLGCLDYNVPWLKIHCRNGQQELALVSKLPTITLKKCRIVPGKARDKYT